MFLIWYTVGMALFSSNSEKIKIHSGNTESSDPVMADIIDLRQLKRDKEARHAHQTRTITSAAQPQENKAPKIISHYFEKKSAQPAHRQKTENRTFSKKIWYGAALFALFGGGFALLTTVFAYATVIVQPKKEERALSNLTVTVDPTLSLADLDTQRIPGEMMQYTDDISMSFPATGEKYVETRARGMLTISNAFSSSPQTLVQSTRFQENKTGRVYRLTKSITIPGAKIENGKIIPSTIDAEVAADGTGDSYNLAEGSFLIPGFQGTEKYKAFTASVKEAIAGGYKGKSKVISKEDLDKAHGAFREEALKRVRAKNSQNLLPEFIVIPAAEKFDILSKSAPNINDPAETFTVKGKVRLTNIAFQQKTLFELLNRIAYKDDASQGKTILPGKSKLDYVSATLLSDNKLQLVISGTLVAAGKIQTVLLQNALVGKSVEDAERILQTFPGVGVFGIKLFPFWKSVLPSQAEKISIEISQET